MSKNDPSKNPSTTSSAYDAMLPLWNKINTVLAGTQAMRDAGPTFLPQHARESADAYQERLGRNVLFNQLDITLDALVGRPFSDPVQIDESTPEAALPILEDIDLQGNNIDVFARRWFRDGLASGFSAVLVDFPRTDNGEPRTLADDTREGVRPYWVSIPAENIIFASADVIGGREVLTHVRVRETTVERFGFSEIEVTRIRVFDRIDKGQMAVFDRGQEPLGLRGVVDTAENDESVGFMFDGGRVRVTVYGEDTKKKGDDPERWVVEDAFIMDFPEIPLAVFYAERDGLMLAKPPLLDLADLNIKHWQSSSDQTMVLTVARFPILAASGNIGSGKEIVVGPHSTLHVEDPNGKWYYVEHSGDAIAAGREDLRNIVEQMSEYGAEFLKQRPGNETATARALDSAEASTPLQDMAIRFSDAMAVAWWFTATWLRVDPSAFGGISVSHDFGPEEAVAADLSELGRARQQRDISRDTYLAEMQRRGVLADDFDAEANERALEEEQEAFAGGIARTDIDPASGDPDDPDDDATGGG